LKKKEKRRKEKKRKGACPEEQKEGYPLKKQKQGKMLIVIDQGQPAFAADAPHTHVYFRSKRCAGGRGYLFLFLFLTLFLFTPSLSSACLLHGRQLVPVNLDDTLFNHSLIRQMLSVGVD